MTTIKEVREALNDVGPNMDPERFRALSASLDGMVLVPKARLVTALAAVGTDMISDDEWQARCELLNAAEDK